MSRKHQYIKDVDKIIARVSTGDLAKVVTSFLKSTKFNIDERRGLMVELKSVARPELPDLEIYPDMFISPYQYGKLKHDAWGDYVGAVIEVAHKTGGELDIIIDVLNTFLREVGEVRLIGMGSSNRYKGVISAMLLLGGYTFKSKRTELGSTRRILCAIEGTEFMNLDDRQRLANDRCRRIGI